MFVLILKLNKIRKSIIDIESDAMETLNLDDECVERRNPELHIFAMKAYKDFDMSHDYTHALAVYSNVSKFIKLVPEERAEDDIKIVKYAAILHDTYDHKYKDKGLGKDVIHDFILSQLGDINGKVCIHIIDNISWSKRKVSTPLNNKDWMRILVQTADWIEALGPTGLERCIEYTRAVHPGCGDLQIRDDVCQHINEKLLKIVDELPEYARQYVIDNNLNDALLIYLK